jgi:hypothetical protein
VTSWKSLVLAGIFHATCTSLVFVVGRAQLLPGLFDRNGVARFTSDSPVYIGDAVALTNQMNESGIAGLLSSNFPLHTKLYSLLFATLGQLIGFNILAAEPLNLLCYVAIIFSVFKLGSEISSRKTGTVAAIIVALWPTLLLHTTQVLKDPIFIALLLGLIVLTTCGLTRSFSTARGLYTGLLSGALAVLLWLMKPDLWPLTQMIILLSLGFQCLRFTQTKQIVKGNLIRSLTLLVLALAVPLVGPRLITPYSNPEPHPLLKESEPHKNLGMKLPSSSAPFFTRLRERMAWARYLYVSYPGTSSNIDPDVRLESWGEVVRYLPRAAEIGLFAPFPKMWFTSGANVGRLGRLISGVETLLIYIFIVFSCWCLWKRRDQLTVWFLLATATLAAIVLGLVVANVGALYRMRYPFWILLIVIGVDGVLRLRRTRITHQGGR